MKQQEEKFRTDYYENGTVPTTLIATARFGDRNKNGHGTFSIVADLYLPYVQRGEPTIKHIKSGEKLWLNLGGQLPNEIRKHLPELAPFLKWHLTSTDGPMHYIENSMYWAKERNLDYFRSTAIWPTATQATMKNVTKEKLQNRLSALMKSFKADMKKLGFKYI